MSQAVKELSVHAVHSRDDVIRRLRAEEEAIRLLGATSLYVFGSAARNEITAESDVDLYFDYVREKGFDYFALCDMQRLIAAALARRVDLMTLYSLHPLLRGEIEASAVKVF